MKNISIFGLWHQGIVAAACLANKGFNVNAYDTNEDSIRILKNGKSPIYEPFLEDLIKKNLNNKLFFRNISEIPSSIQDICLLMVDTPVNDNDESDLSKVFEYTELIAQKFIKKETIVINTSQVSVGTSNELNKLILKHNPDYKFGVAYIPENLQLGNAIERFYSPPLPVIGTDHVDIYPLIIDFLDSFDSKWQKVDLKTAEMIKHAMNSFIALSISFGNEIGAISENVGANGQDVSKILKIEPRVGNNAMIRPGLAFSGGTLARDLQTLRHIGRKKNIETPLLDGIWKRNKIQNQQILEKLRKNLNSLEEKIITILGLTYKENTDTLRRSASIELIQNIQDHFKKIKIHDPKIKKIIHSQHKFDSNKVFLYDSISQACENSDAIVLMTAWEDYKNIEFQNIQETMNGNYVIDTACLWDKIKSNHSLNIELIGLNNKT